MIDGPRKIIRSAGPGQELVAIDGEYFAVTPPWLGHSLPQVIDPRNPGLVMLPREMTFEERKIFVTAETRQAFLEMAEAAALDGVRLQVDSGYRSAGYQRAIFRKRLAAGIDFAEISKSVAPPGYSEHMLGCTLDLVPSNWSFKGTPADLWLRANAARFSFVQSYPANNTKGFSWEPWHWKYVGNGTDESQQVRLPKKHES
jgi:D-alanyl-D-alanine carboxypeptidase